MRYTTLQRITEETEFAQEAADWFEEHPEHQTYGGMEAGELFATRWGNSQDCVLVFKIDPNTEPILYVQAINGALLTVPMKSYGKVVGKARLRTAED